MVSIFLFQKELIHRILNTLSGPFSVLLVVIYIPNKVFLGPFGTKIGDILPNHLAEGFLSVNGN